MRWSVLTCVIPLLLSAPAFSAPEILIELTGLASTNGQVLVSLFSQAKGFPSDHTRADQTASITPVRGTTTLSFTNVASGSYAIAVCHDTNGNGKMDTKRFGQPLEGFALYRNQQARLGPPKFKNSEFTVGTNSVAVKIKIQYPNENQ